MLLREHLPQFKHPYKAALFEMAYPEPVSAAGVIEVTRWAPYPVDPIDFASLSVVELRPDFYDYVPAGDIERDVEWHVNFADPDLFVAYGSPLLAQDEM